MSTVIVVAGGDPPTAALLDELPTDGPVIVADGGLAAVRTLGLRPALLIGDLDTVTSSELQWAERQGAVIDQRPALENASQAPAASDKPG